MALPKVMPALADLTQDIAGPIPVQLLQDWATGAQDLPAAESLLQPFQIHGTVVASDTSGLSRLTQQMELLDVLSLISQPKEIVYALGRQVGGRAIGVWVADNTEMFYARGLESETVVDAMAEARFRIQQRLHLDIGMCIHAGSFYEIGGGLYGPDADRVEHLAEHCAAPGEILITGRLAGGWQASGPSGLLPKALAPEDTPEPVFVLDSDRRMPQLQESETLYPHPFPQEFYRLLPHFHEPEEAAKLKQKAYERWLRECTVVFVARQRQALESQTLDDMLDALVINALMDTVLREAIPGTDYIASSGGGLAILTFDTPREALDFVHIAQPKLAENGLPVRVGMDAGPVLFFQNLRGPSGITGDPVNIASKLAEDREGPGSICVTDRVFQQLRDVSASERFETTLSGISLKGAILA